MQKIKRPLSIILAILMLVTMIPLSSLTAGAVNISGAATAGDFYVGNGEPDVDFTYSNGVLTILTGKNMEIGNIYPSVPSKDTIVVAKDVSANLNFVGLNIDVVEEKKCAFQIADGSKGNVTINLADGCYNYLRSGEGCAGLQKNGRTDSGTLTIQGSGYLTATSYIGGAGIGGGAGLARGDTGYGCNIHIKGGNIYAESINRGRDWGIGFLATGGAGIGGGIWGGGCNITISGGNVTAIGAEEAAGIGAGAPDGYTDGQDQSGYIEGECQNVSITGGTVVAKAGKYGSAIGGRMNNDKCSDNYISGGVVTLLKYTDEDINLNSPTSGVYCLGTTYKGGVIYEGDIGTVYGNSSLPADHTVASGKVLTIPENATLTVPQGITLTNNGNILKLGKLVVNGTVTCNGHEFVDAVCVKCFNPCTHTSYSNGFCTGCDKAEEAISDSNGCYEIDNAGKLYWFAEKSKSDKTISAKLTADITVNNGKITADSANARSWTPLAYGYSGTFDGNNYSISGLYYNDSSESYIGFAESLADEGVVKNLTIKNSYFNAKDTVGSITGCNSGVITNCHSSATVSGVKTVGGITGVNYSTISKCSNTGKVTAAENMAAGIAAMSTANGDKADSVSYCSNAGDVIGTELVGGIVGYGYSTPIKNCYNTGLITCTEETINIGAIVGYNNSFSAAVNCYYLDTSCKAGVSGIDYKGYSESATVEQFNSGEIAYRLNGNGEKVWCQKIGKDEFPQFKGDKVYYGYTSCSSAAEQEYTNIGTASSTKPDHTEKTAANCVDLAVCGICSESYGKTNADNHKSDETYSVYVDDTHHKDYHSCCDALIGNCSHSKSTAANCISKDYCNECKSYYGSINASNHADEFTWADNGDGTHSKKWECCNLIENEIKPHSFTITADDKNNVITASCNDCEYEASITLVVPEGELVYDGTSQYVYTKGYIHGLDRKIEIYANGELYEGAWSDAGKYTQVLTVGGKSVSVEYEIQKKELTVRELWVADKDFDGTRKMKVYDVYFDGLNAADDVEANCDNAYTYAPSNRAGDYTTVSGLTGVTVEGDDMRNYIIPEISEDVEYSADYSIYPYEVRIVPEHQYITDASKLDTAKFTIDTEIPEGYTIEGMAVALDGTEIIVVDDSNAKVMYGDEDFTDCFYFNTYSTAAVVICCEGHKANENGFCSTGTCSAYEPAKVNDNGTPEDYYDDYYEISNAGQLFWFAKQVNGYGDQYAAAKLTADIDLNPGYTFNADGTYTGGSNPREWTPIGFADGYSPYTGVFDGNGHTISGMYVNTPDDNYVGMFGGCDYGNTIKNLKLTNSYFSGRSYVGSLIGYAGTTVSGCYIDNSVTVKGNGYSVGGIVGELAYNAVKNCISFANVIDEESELFVGKNYGEVINCYYSADGTGTTRTDAVAKTEEEFASGEVAYLLQSGVEEEYIYDAEADDYIPVIPHIWGQKIGTDKFPVINGEKVYYGYKDCNATEKTYCNNNAYDEIPTHSFENGKCTICGDEDPYVNLVLIFGDINLELEETEANIFTGVTELQAGTYKFNLNDKGVVRGMNYTYTDTATINYSAGYKAPSTFKVTGGRYTFTYNATSKKLTIKFKNFEDIVELVGDINAELVRPNKNTTVFTGTIRLEAGTYRFNVNEHGTIFGLNYTFTDVIYEKEFVFKSPVTFIATGGIYSVRYDTANNQLKILHAPEGLGDVSIFGDLCLPLASQGNGVYSAPTVLDAGSYDIRIDSFGTLFGNGTEFTNTINTAFNTEWKAAATLKVTERQKFTFIFDTNTNKVKVFNAPIDPTKIKVSFDNINPLVLTSVDGITYEGTVALKAGTYIFRMDEFGTPMGGKYSFTDNSNSMTYNASYASATTMTATGGKYTFTYNANKNSLKVTKV